MGALCARAGVYTKRSIDHLTREEMLEMVFDHLDDNANGVLTLDELLTESSRLSRAEVELVRKELETTDTNGDHVIEKDEFVQTHLKAYLKVNTKEFEKWVLMVLNHHRHSDKELQEWGVERASSKFLGGKYSEEEDRRRRKAMERAKEKQRLAEKQRAERAAMRAAKKRLDNLRHDLEEEIDIQEGQKNTMKEGYTHEVDAENL